MSTRPNEKLDRPSVELALAKYLLETNFRGYQPDDQKVLAIRRSDRTAWLRNAEKPVLWERYYFIEGELFPEPGRTKVPRGVSPLAHARELIDGIWEQLWVWSGFDFTATSYGLNRMLDPVPASVLEEGGLNVPLD